MACNGDYMNPNDAEINSKRVATLLVYVNEAIGKETMAYVKKAAVDPYGSPKDLDDLTRKLCLRCSEMSPDDVQRIIYDGRNPLARDLAEWWEEHQRADAARIALEEYDAKVIAKAEELKASLDTPQLALIRAAVERGLI